MRQTLPVVPVAGLGGFFTVVDVACAQPWATTTAPGRAWTALASSADGYRVVAAAGRWEQGSIYTSTNSGDTWKATSAPSDRWQSVASSADGATLVVIGNSIYTSSNSGVTWALTTAPTNGWSSVASSADGDKLVAARNSIYTSSNSGATWTPTSAPINSWWSVASSADGTTLVAVAGGWSRRWDLIYISTNSGATWTPAGEPAAGWSAVASSADGSNIVAVGYQAICTLRSPAPVPPLPPSPHLAVGLSGASLGLSWLVPSTRFVLQQNSDLSSTNWVEVPTPPTLDYTNLHQRLTLTPSFGSSYFRFKQQ